MRLSTRINKLGSDDSVLLVYDPASQGIRITTFRRNVLPSSTRANKSWASTVVRQDMQNCEYFSHLTTTRCSNGI